jgi:hypothetical protein
MVTTKQHRALQVNIGKRKTFETRRKGGTGGNAGSFKTPLLRCLSASVFQKGVPQWAGKKATFVSADRPGKATDLELASLKTWMAVEEAEQREEESRPIHPL